MNSKEEQETKVLPAYIRKCLNDIITIDPFLSLSFPEHSDELRWMFAAFPRQGFSRDFATVPAIIQRTTEDGEIDITWAMQMPRFNENFEAVAELFFKIENFVIRPKIKKMIENERLLRAVEIGTIAEIADSISADQTEQNLINDALVFGSNILLEIKIIRQARIVEFDNDKTFDRKQPETKQERLTSAEDKIFRYFDVYTLSGTDSVSGHKKTKDKAAGESRMVIIISPQYATLIDATLNIPEEGKERNEAVQLPALALRVLELIRCAEFLGIPQSSRVGEDQEEIEIDFEELSELVPMKNSNKINQLIAQLWRVPANPENN